MWPVRKATASSSQSWSTITECDIRCIAQPSARESYDHRAAKRRCAFRGMLGLKVHSLQRSQPRRLSCPEKLAKAAVSARRVDRRPAVLDSVAACQKPLPSLRMTVFWGRRQSAGRARHSIPFPRRRHLLRLQLCQAGTRLSRLTRAFADESEDTGHCQTTAQRSRSFDHNDALSLRLEVTVPASRYSGHVNSRHRILALPITLRAGPLPYRLTQKGFGIHSCTTGTRCGARTAHSAEARARAYDLEGRRVMANLGHETDPWSAQRRCA